MRTGNLGRYEPITTAPRDGALAWVYCEAVGEVLARHIGVGAWRGSRQLIAPTHWRPATAEEVASFERENPRSRALRGLCWNEIDRDLVLRHFESRTGNPLEIKLRDFPFVVSELSHFDIPSMRGPIIIDPDTKLPWDGNKFRKTWRAIATEVGVPKNVKNGSRRDEVEAYQSGMAQMAASGKRPPRSFIGSAGEDEESDN